MIKRCYAVNPCLFLFFKVVGKTQAPSLTHETTSNLLTINFISFKNLAEADSFAEANLLAVYPM